MIMHVISSSSLVDPFLMHAEVISLLADLFHTHAEIISLLVRLETQSLADAELSMFSVAFVDERFGSRKFLHPRKAIQVGIQRGEWIAWLACHGPPATETTTHAVGQLGFAALLGAPRRLRRLRPAS